MSYTATEQREHRCKLVTALRDGSYKQGRGCLRMETQEGTNLFCCLGVAADLHSIDTGTQWVKLISEKQNTNYSYLDNINVLPDPDVKNYYGFTVPSGLLLRDVPVCGTSTFASLASLNDDGVTFNQIADIIEWYFND